MFGKEPLRCLLCRTDVRVGSFDIRLRCHLLKLSSLVPRREHKHTDRCLGQPKASSSAFSLAT